MPSTNGRFDADLATEHLHHKANTIGSGKAQDDPTFFPRIDEALQNSEAVLIVGPGNEKTLLLKYLEESPRAAEGARSSRRALRSPDRSRNHRAGTPSLPSRRACALRRVQSRAFTRSQEPRIANCLAASAADQIGHRHGGHRAHQRPGKRHEPEQSLQRAGDQEECDGERAQRSNDQGDMRRRRAPRQPPGSDQENHQDLRCDRFQEPSGLELRRVGAEALQENQKRGRVEQRTRPTPMTIVKRKIAAMSQACGRAVSSASTESKGMPISERS